MLTAVIGSNRRAQVAETVTKAVKSAGGLVTAALAIAAGAFIVAMVALVLAVRRPAVA
jgi:hypothetical protein